MPSFVTIIALLSVLSFLYSMKVFSHEAHRMQLVTQPFGGGIHRMMEQVIRLGIASLFTALSLMFVGISLALIWLSLQPAMVG